MSTQRDLLKKLQNEWTGKKRLEKVKTLVDLEVHVKPLPFKARQRMYEDKITALPELVVEYIRLPDGKPLFDPQDEQKRIRNVGRILAEEIDPAILEELGQLLLEEFAVEDVDQGKPDSGAAKEST